MTRLPPVFSDLSQLGKHLQSPSIQSTLRDQKFAGEEEGEEHFVLAPQPLGHVTEKAVGQMILQVAKSLGQNTALVAIFNRDPEDVEKPREGVLIQRRDQMKLTNSLKVSRQYWYLKCMAVSTYPKR